VTLYWVTAGLSLLGTWLNVRRHRACFAIWTATNAVWIQASFSHGLPEKGTLHVAYLLLALYGAWHWRPRSAPAEGPAP